MSLSNDSLEKVMVRLCLSVHLARITSKGRWLWIWLTRRTTCCGVSLCPVKRCPCGNRMTLVFLFGKRGGVAAGVLIGVFCQVDD